MQIAHRKEQHRHAILTQGQALILLVVLAIIAVDTVAILVVLGMMTFWEAAVTVFTVLAVAAGAMWTLLLAPQKRVPVRKDGDSSEAAPEGMPASE